jgi:hypothetical protein
MLYMCRTVILGGHKTEPQIQHFQPGDDVSYGDWKV